MKARQPVRLGWIAGATLLVIASPGLTEDLTTNHSGTVVAISEAAGTITLAETRPLRTSDDILIRELTIAVTPGTVSSRKQSFDGYRRSRIDLETEGKASSSPGSRAISVTRVQIQFSRRGVGWLRRDRRSETSPFCELISRQDAVYAAVGRTEAHTTECPEPRRINS